jgi:hypothetical protein
LYFCSLNDSESIGATKNCTSIAVRYDLLCVLNYYQWRKTSAAFVPVVGFTCLTIRRVEANIEGTDGRRNRASGTCSIIIIKFTFYKLQIKLEIVKKRGSGSSMSLLSVFCDSKKWSDSGGDPTIQKKGRFKSYFGLLNRHLNLC